MPLADRDYMQGNRTPGTFGSNGGRKGLLLAIVLIAIAALGWYGFTRYANRAPAEGSLRVNINTATQTEIETLPGIGPALAGRIIAGRPYAEVDELARVRGISERQVRELQPSLTATEATQLLEQRKAGGRLFDWVDSLVYSRVMLDLLASAVVVYIAYSILRWWLLRRCNARTIRDANEAERRRWEGHRLEGNRKGEKPDPGPTGIGRQ
jgi:hypothetical protein